MLWYAVEGGGGGGGGGDGGEEENAEDRRDPKVGLPNFVPMCTLEYFFSFRYSQNGDVGPDTIPE